jgi:23S rRNA U2552 (ribose-2'-O)-methylase RlmE/FtsJ
MSLNKSEFLPYHIPKNMTMESLIKLIDEKVFHLTLKDDSLNKRRHFNINGFCNLIKSNYKPVVEDWRKCGEEVLLDLNSFEKLGVLAKGLNYVKVNAMACPGPQNEYWRVRQISRMRGIEEQEYIDAHVHPVLVYDPRELRRNSKRLIDELDYEFNFLGIETKDLVSKALYFGDLPGDWSEWMETYPKVNFDVYDAFANSWESLMDSESVGFLMFEKYENKLKSEWEENPYDFIICDSTIESEYDHLHELQNNYFLFKQIYLSYKYLKHGGKLLIKVPSIFHEITREILSIFCAHFESYKFVKPISSQIGCEDTFLFLEHKMYTDAAPESRLFLNSINLYFDAFQRRNEKMGKQHAVIFELLTERDKLILKEELDYFSGMSELVRNYMRSQYSDVVNYKTKSYEISIEDRKVLSDRFTSRIDAYKEWVSTMRPMSNGSIAVIPSSNIFLISDPAVPTLPVVDTTGKFDGSYVVNEIIDAVTEIPQFPCREIYTDFGPVSDNIPVANRIAYDRPPKQDRDPDIVELSKFTNNYKYNIIASLNFMKQVIDCGCGKGVDIQKYRFTGIEKYIGIDISGNQLAQMMARNEQGNINRFEVETYNMDYTQPGILPGLMDNTLITAFHTFSQICTSKEKLAVWLQNNFRYKNTVLIGTFMSKSVIQNEFYRKKFKVRHNGNLMMFDIPGLVNNAVEYCLEPREIQEVVRSKSLRCFIFDYDRFTSENETLSSRCASLVSDLKFIIIYNKRYTDNPEFMRFMTNIANDRFKFK